MGKGLSNNDQKTTSENGTKKVIVFVKHDQSMISELYYNDGNMRTLFRLIIFANLLHLVSDIICDSLNAKRLYWKNLEAVEVPTLKSVFVAITVDGTLHMAAFLLYPMFKLWAWLRTSSKSTATGVDVLFVGIYLIGVVLSFVYITVGLWHPSLDTNMFTRIVLSTEQVRLCMKSYAFIRENAYKVLYPWHKDDTSGPAVWYKGQMSPVVGSFKQYCYFLFAPTLLYRDHYPRSSGPINWTTVATNLCFFVGGLMVSQQILYGALVYDYKWTSILLSFMFVIGMALILLPLFTVYATHGWMNMWAELIRFGDRRCYEDWWACTKYQEYYRKWNIIPYHFNHQYIYKDIRKVTGSTLFATFLLISISSIVHEYVIAVTMGFILPALTIFFAGIGVFVIFFRLGSKYILLSLCIGGTMTFWPYFIESNARMLCPREETWVDLVYPRSIECFMQYNY